MDEPRLIICREKTVPCYSELFVSCRSPYTSCSDGTCTSTAAVGTCGTCKTSCGSLEPHTPSPLSSRHWNTTSRRRKMKEMRRIQFSSLSSTQTPPGSGYSLTRDLSRWTAGCPTLMQSLGKNPVAVLDET